MAITVTREMLEELSGTEISSSRFSAIKSVVTSLIQAYYYKDVSTATGRHEAVINSVFIRVALRLVTNPTGARSLGLGSASVTFGGSDEDFANIGSLSNDERKALRSLRNPAPHYIRHTPADAPILPIGYSYFNYGTDTGSLPGTENVTIVVQEGS